MSDDEKLAREKALADAHDKQVDPPPHRAVNRRSVRYVVSRLLGTPASILGTLLLIGFGAIALAAPMLAPCPPDQKITCQQHVYKVPRYGFTTQPEAPSAAHRFGLTPQRNDIYYGVIWGTRTAFKAGVTIIALALVLGLTIGSIAAYYGGWIDEVLNMLTNVVLAAER